MVARDIRTRDIRTRGPATIFTRRCDGLRPVKRLGASEFKAPALPCQQLRREHISSYVSSDLASLFRLFFLYLGKPFD